MKAMVLEGIPLLKENQRPLRMAELPGCYP